MVKLILHPPKLPGAPEFGPVDWNHDSTADLRRASFSSAGGVCPISKRTTSMTFDQVVEKEGDVLDTPKDSLILHACNCKGIWGAGIAKQLAEKFPAAYAIYKSYCPRNKSIWMERLGTALLIPPQKEDEKTGGRHWIGCLFTKIYPGAPQVPFGHADVIDATKMALDDLNKQVQKLGVDAFSGGIYAPLLNAGIFAIPWPITRRQLQDIGIPVTVLFLPGMEDEVSPLRRTVREFEHKVRIQRDNQSNMLPQIKQAEGKRSSRSTSVASRSNTSLNSGRAGNAKKYLGSQTREQHKAAKRKGIHGEHRRSTLSPHRQSPRPSIPIRNIGYIEPSMAQKRSPWIRGK